MRKKVLFLDLDNTIYPVSSIAPKLFEELYVHIKTSGEYKGSIEDVILEIQRTPFQKVAEAFAFSPQLLEECLQILSDLEYAETMEYFPDYEKIRQLPHQKFLVTSGFSKMQHSKIDRLGIQNDFEAIHIIDLQQSVLTKKEVFQMLIKKHQLLKAEILVVGDDLKSEIKAGKELGLDTVLYNKIGSYPNDADKNIISDFGELEPFL